MQTTTVTWTCTLPVGVLNKKQGVKPTAIIFSSIPVKEFSGKIPCQYRLTVPVNHVYGQRILIKMVTWIFLSEGGLNRALIQNQFRAFCIATIQKRVASLSPMCLIQ